MALPGLRGIEHVGLTVPDLGQAVDFFVNVLGCEEIFGEGPFENDPQLMRDRLNVHPDASLRYTFLRCATGPNLEVFEYRAPDQNTAPPRNSDIGGHHLAFYVDDFAAALAYLDSQGVKLLQPASLIESGPAMGSRWVYFIAPWGLQLELCSYPGGKGDATSPARRLWHPARPGGWERQ